MDALEACINSQNHKGLIALAIYAMIEHFLGKNPETFKSDGSVLGMLKNLVMGTVAIIIFVVVVLAINVREKFSRKGEKDVDSEKGS